VICDLFPQVSAVLVSWCQVSTKKRMPFPLVQTMPEILSLATGRTIVLVKSCQSNEPDQRDLN
jgi:hypothetical protein